MKETPLMHRIMLAIGHGCVRIYRNNVGVGWAGKLVSNANGMTVLKGARPLHAGLCEGSSDLIGWVTHTIRPEDVGRRVAIFFAPEVKTPDGRTDKKRLALQREFQAAVRAAGGIAGEVRSEDEARRMIDDWMNTPYRMPPLT